jgi:outer membrane protein assembly factor BamB
MSNKDDGTGPEAAPSDNLARSTNFRPLRTWPALLLVALMFVTRFGPNLLEGGPSGYWMVSVFGPLLCCLLLVIWWLAASRATWKERLFGTLGLIGALALALWLADPTMRGPGTTTLTVPMGMVVFGLGAALLRARRPAIRTGVALLLALAGFGFTTLLRNEGMTGNYVLGLHWRWSLSPEESLLAARKTAAKPDRMDSGKIREALSHPEWSGFRGPDRASRSLGPQISTNWAALPPRLLWKIAVGPAWSSFAVAGNLLFTQEQRGPMETVACYDADTGREAWNQQIEARLEDPMGGPGPRATPTLASGGLFITGATGKFLRLDPATGDVVWKQDLSTVAGRKAPMWGFAASPLVTGSVVIVYAGGSNGKGVLAFDSATGAPRWSAAAGTDSYSSPQLNTIAGEDLVLMLSNEGLVFLDPASGKARLNYEWKFSPYRALQPRLVGDDLILLPTGMNAGTRAIRVTKPNGQLAAEELWTSRNLKPDFTDIVTYQGYAYGLDAGIFTCVDLKTGQRKWKGGRYGQAQILLLENSGLILVAAESGQVVLLAADPNEHVEVASFKALAGKTWNHPVVVGDRLYIRNSQEAAAYQLPLANTKLAADIQ